MVSSEWTRGVMKMTSQSYIHPALRQCVTAQHSCHVRRFSLSDIADHTTDDTKCQIKNCTNFHQFHFTCLALCASFFPKLKSDAIKPKDKEWSYSLFLLKQARKIKAYFNHNCNCFKKNWYLFFRMNNFAFTTRHIDCLLPNIFLVSIWKF